MDNVCIARSETERTEVLKLIKQVKDECSESRNIPTTTLSPQIRDLSQVQIENFKLKHELKSCLENLADAHNLIHTMTFASELKNLSVEEELAELKKELESAQHTKHILYFFVTLFTLAFVSFGILVYRAKSASRYARGFFLI